MSDFESIGALGAGWRERLAERLAWEQEHPAMALAWSEALEMDSARTKRLEIELARQEARRRLPAQLLRIGAPPKLVNCLDPKCRDESAAIRLARRFLESPDTWCLVLLGSTGAGKSAGALWALGELLVRFSARSRPSGDEVRREEPGVFLHTGEFSGLGFDEDSRQRFQRFCTVYALVFDDLGADFVSGPVNGWFEELIDRRYSAGRKTILTSNLNQQAFEARVGPRVWDRIRDGAVVGVCAGKSLRGPREVKS